MPGHQVVIVDTQQDPTHLRCRKCRFILRDAVQMTENGRLYCESCTIFQDKNEWVSDKAVQKEVMDLYVRCGNTIRGCQWQGVMAQNQEHLDSCMFKDRISELEQLQQENCMMREQCMLQAQQLWHMQQLIYQEPKTHLQTTLDTNAPDKDDLSSALFSFPLPLPEGNDEKGDLILFEGEDEMDDIIPLAEEAQQWEQQPSSDVPDPDFDDFLEEQEPGSPVDKCTNVDTGSDSSIVNVKESVTTLKERHRQLAADIDQSDTDVQLHAREVGRLSRLTATSVKANCENHKGSKVDNRLLNCIEPCPVSVETPARGIRYRCKIQNIAEKFRYAKSHPDHPLISSNWLTHPGGYTMQTHVYLNGNGHCLGSHVSAFMAVRPDQYNAQLAWPLKGRLSFFILDQDKNHRHIVRTVRHDPKSSSFQRPSQNPGSAANVASGCPDLTPISTVMDNNNYYVKNDAMIMEFCLNTSS